MIHVGAEHQLVAPHPTTPHDRPLQQNPDTEIASFGRRLILNSTPAIQTGRMASVWASHGILSSAPWKIVGSLHHVTEDLGSLRGHIGPCSYQSNNPAISGHSSALSVHSAVLCSSVLSCMHRGQALLSHTPWLSTHGFLTTSPVFN
jgi:hypothetical protein